MRLASIQMGPVGESSARPVVPVRWHVCAKIRRLVAELWGPPYPPLSKKQARSNYGFAGMVVLIAAGIVGETTPILIVPDDPSHPDKLPPGMKIAFCVCCYLIATGILMYGIRGAYKTCKAPRLGEEAALLPRAVP